MENEAMMMPLFSKIMFLGAGIVLFMIIVKIALILGDHGRRLNELERWRKQKEGASDADYIRAGCKNPLCPGDPSTCQCDQCICFQHWDDDGWPTAAANKRKAEGRA